MGIFHINLSMEWRYDLILWKRNEVHTVGLMVAMCTIALKNNIIMAHNWNKIHYPQIMPTRLLFYDVPQNTYYVRFA